MKVFKQWERLSPGRRGWAMGGIFGLLMTLLAYNSWNHFYRIGSVYYFPLPSLGALPGIIGTEKFILYVCGSPYGYHYNRLQYLHTLFASLINYPLWAGFLAILFKITEKRIPLPWLLQVFFVFGFFVGMVVVSFCLNRGVQLEGPLSAVFYLLFTGWFLCLLSLGELLLPLLSMRSGQTREKSSNASPSL